MIYNTIHHTLKEIHTFYGTGGIILRISPADTRPNGDELTEDDYIDEYACLPWAHATRFAQAISSRRPVTVGIEGGAKFSFTPATGAKPATLSISDDLDKVVITLYPKAVTALAQEINDWANLRDRTRPMITQFRDPPPAGPGLVNQSLV